MNVNTRSNKTYLMVLVINALLILGYYNWSIIGKENILVDGQLVILELAPADPRSIMQGDYMIINYKFINDADDVINPPVDVIEDDEIASVEAGDGEILEDTADYQPRKSLPSKGYMVFDIEDNGVGVLSDVLDDNHNQITDADNATGYDDHDSAKLAIKYNKRGWRVFIGSDTYFFQEGSADKYDSAKYGGVRVDSKGQAMLIYLYDEHLQIIE